MNRDALSAAVDHFHRMRDLASHFEEASQIARAIQDRQSYVDTTLDSAVLQVARHAEIRWRQLDLDSSQLRAMQGLMPSLSNLTDQVSAVQSVLNALQVARTQLEGSADFLRYARSSVEAFIDSVYNQPDLLRDPVRWVDEEIDRLLADDPKYRQSRLAWILVMFVPRFRRALYEQDSEGDFDGVMQVLWEDLLEDPEVRARLRERLEKSGVREELRQSLSNHLDKLETGELMYAILGLYVHIEGFLAELVVERGLIPDHENILRPDGKKQQRPGVYKLIRILHENGQIDDSQEKFLTFVLSNSYQANRLRHGVSFEFTQERATALVLALILILCLSSGLKADELLDADESWIDDILDDEQGKQDAPEDIERFIDEILGDDNTG